MKNTAIISLTIATVCALTVCNRTSIASPQDASAPLALTSASTSVPVAMELPAPVAAMKTSETRHLKEAIDTYIFQPSPLNEATVNKTFAELSVEIAKLQERAEKTAGSDREEAIVKAKNLADYRDKEARRFAMAKTGSEVPPNPHVDSRTGEQKMEDGAKDAAHTIENGANDAAMAVEHAAKKTGEALKDAVR